jgi:G2/mitotic-specific cyclin-B2
MQTATLVHYSGYEETKLEYLMCRMCQLVLKAGTGKLTAIKTKYSSSKFMRISKLPQLESQLINDFAARAASQS